MNIVIDKAVLNNAKAISQLTNELGYPCDEYHSKEWLSVMLNSSHYGVFVATLVDGSICGWVAVEKRLSLQSGYKAEITGLVTGAKFRRLGIGKKLLRTCERWSVQKGLNKLVVASNIQREESHLFYKDIGFLVNKTSHKYAKLLNN